MKAANRNLILLLAPSLLIAAAGALLFAEGGSSFRAAQNSMPALPGSAGDVEGYAFLLQFFGSGIGQLAALALQVIGFLIAGYGVLLLVLSVLGRVLYKPSARRLLAYRIVTGLQLALMLFPVPWLAASFFKSALAFAPQTELVPPLVLLVVPSVFVIRTTYTRRIREDHPAQEQA